MVYIFPILKICGGGKRGRAEFLKFLIKEDLQKNTVDGLCESVEFDMPFA